MPVALHHPSTFCKHSNLELWEVLGRSCAMVHGEAGHSSRMVHPLIYIHGLVSDSLGLAGG